MIHISQGHEKGIGLEVFLKSFLTIPVTNTDKILLHVFEKSLIKNLHSLKIDHTIIEDGVKISGRKLRTKWLKQKSEFQSTDSLNSCLNDIKKNDILITLPTSKDQLEINSTNLNGHTEFFRKYFNREVEMVFISPNHNLLLLTDHIPLKNVSDQFNELKIVKIIERTIKSISKFRSINTVLLSGPNPHNGEGGRLGDEENKKFSSLDFKKNISFEIIPGDTIFNHFNVGPKTLVVASFHDQGLAPFKNSNKFIGLNFTSGLDFLRFSPDHGTAFHLYGMNRANYFGMLYVLLESLKIDRGEKL
jgi:4-hydroxythreonine-4-phosphate dehydrogenase